MNVLLEITAFSPKAQEEMRRALEEMPCVTNLWVTTMEMRPCGKIIAVAKHSEEDSIWPKLWALSNRHHDCRVSAENIAIEYASPELVEVPA